MYYQVFLGKILLFLFRIVMKSGLLILNFPQGENRVMLLRQQLKVMGVLKLQKKLKIDMNKKNNWEKLKMHLYFMNMTGLIEERHFPDGIVDYSAEDAGMKLLKKL